MTISIKIREQSLSSDRDYSFLSKENVRFEVEENFFAHIIDANIAAVQVKNAINQSIIIFRNFKLSKL